MDASKMARRWTFIPLNQIEVVLPMQPPREPEPG